MASGFAPLFKNFIINSSFGDLLPTSTRSLLSMKFCSFDESIIVGADASMINEKIVSAWVLFIQLVKGFSLFFHFGRSDFLL
jgi:hypothetical protein